MAKLPDLSSHEGPRQPGPAIPVFATSLVVLLAAALPWARRWIYSGCAVESLLILYGYGTGSRILSFLDLWPLLATFNLVYAVCSTSWLLFWFFSLACYPFIFITCLWQFAPAADLARKTLRKWLRQIHFTRDKIALFNLPALEIDVDVDGLFVIRGLTVSLSSLTIVAHGVELGIKMSDTIEMAISVDEVMIALFRKIHIGEVYANLKGEDEERTFAQPEVRADRKTYGDDVFVENTPLLNAASAGSAGFEDRPELHRLHTKPDSMTDSSAKESLEPVTVLSPDDKNAEARYRTMLDDIRRTSAVGQSRGRVAATRTADAMPGQDDSAIERVAIVAALHELTSLPHPPSRSIRVTTLQTIAPRFRKFLHRLPLLLRLQLSLISHMHPVTVSNITVGVSGAWIARMLRQKVFKQYSEASSKISRLEEKVAGWLADANFCVQLSGFEALAQVPVMTSADIATQLAVKNIAAYRSVLKDGQARKVVQLGGADGMVKVPIYLLPHHEHIVPPRPTREDSDSKNDEDLNTTKDEAEVTFNVHASLPASFDQSLLGFVAALVKASKVIELEKELSEDQPEDIDADEPSTPTSGGFDSEQASTLSAPLSPKTAGFKAFAKNVRQNLKDGTAGQSIKEFAKELNQTTKDSMKKAVVVGVVNDGWIAKMVGKIAVKLEEAQGSVGYSGGIPVPLEPYRGPVDLPLKLLS